jgi:geranylgeranyl diphosphate synthase type II
MQLGQEWQNCRQQFSHFITSYFSETSELIDAMMYTLKQGKKFRPFLTYATAVALDRPIRPTTAFAVATEMVHAFSLIHDDLPALDNDDFRRGIPTNHKVYGQAVAILAGDALLNEAFAIIPKYYNENPKLALELIQTLSHAVGTKGMIEGQVRDLKAQGLRVDYPTIRRVHELKTGALIRASVVGSALICDSAPKQLQQLHVYSEALGLAFQIADDLLEAKDGKEELGSYVGILGLEKAQEKLLEASDEAKRAINDFPNPELLKQLVEENQNRNL